MDDLGAVMEEAESGRAVLVASGELGLVAILFAATHRSQHCDRREVGQTV
jgi:hypothetical protein